MQTVSVRNVVIGEGMPKICTPIVGTTREEIIEEVKAISALPADIVEWRVDWYEDVFDPAETLSVLRELRKIIGEMPLLMTFRTLKEGGSRDIGAEEYTDINIMAAESGLVDMIDVELFMGDDIVEKIISRAHETGVKVVVSNHDFGKTPSEENLIERLRRMQDLGADIPKIAVTPSSKKDVLTLLSATEEMVSQYADRPIITMSMGAEGAISRIAGEFFGSAVTFGSGVKASAPGQIGVRQLKTLLEDLHDIYADS